MHGIGLYSYVYRQLRDVKHNKDYYRDIARRLSYHVAQFYTDEKLEYFVQAARYEAAKGNFKSVTWLHTLAVENNIPLSSEFYEWVLKGYASHGALQQACGWVYDAIQRSGLLPDNHVLERIAYGFILRDGKQVLGTVQAMMQHYPTLRQDASASFLCSLARAYLSNGMAQEYLMVMEEMRRRGMQPTKALLDAQMHHAVARQDSRTIACVLKQWSQTQRLMDVRAVNSLISFLSSEKDGLKVAHDVVKAMEQRGTLVVSTPEPVTVRLPLPRVDTYNTLLDANVRHGDYSSLNDWNTIKGDAYTFNILLKARLKQGNMEQAVAVLDRMSALQLDDDVVTRTQMIHYAVEDLGISAMERLVHEMALDKLEPDVVTHAVVIKGHAIYGNVDAAWKVYHDIHGQMNPVSHQMVLASLLMVPQPYKHVQLQRIMARIQQNNITPNAILWTRIMACALHVGRTGFAHNVFFKYLQRPVCDRAYTILLAYYARRGNLPRVYALFNQLKASKRRGESLGVHAWTCLIHAHVMRGNMEQAQDVFWNDMRADNSVANTATFTAMIKGFLRTGQRQEATQWLHLMQQYGLEPNRVTLKTVQRLR
jgi:pentatricopeptide repeat protein